MFNILGELGIPSSQILGLLLHKLEPLLKGLNAHQLVLPLDPELVCVQASHEQGSAQHETQYNFAALLFAEVDASFARFEFTLVLGVVRRRIETAIILRLLFLLLFLDYVEFWDVLQALPQILPAGIVLPG